MTQPSPTGNGRGRPLGDRGRAFDGRFTGTDRLLVVAPHPDDESLATGGILQTATAAGAMVRLLFLTDGENNPWAQRATELCLFVGEKRRRRFGERRRREVVSALEALNVDPGESSFAGLPDQGLTSLLLGSPQRLIEPIAVELERVSPTVLAFPSMSDLHPDHSATAVAVNMALRRSTGAEPVRLAYVIHQPVAKGARLAATAVALAGEQRERKRNAILAHRTQHRLRGPWLLSFARDEEAFFDDTVASCTGHPVVSALLGETGLQLIVESRNHPRAFGSRRLALLVDAWPVGEVTAHLLTLSRAGSTGRVVPEHDRELFEGTRWDGRGGRGCLTVPLGPAFGAATIYAKVLRRFGFFDEAGWRCVAP